MSLKAPVPGRSTHFLRQLIVGSAILGSAVLPLACRTAPTATPADALASAPTRAPAVARPPPLRERALADEVLYLVMVDRFADADGADFPGRDPSLPLAFHGGDLSGVLSKLDYLTDLGVTTLWLTPLSTQVGAVPHEGGGEHHPFHGYWPSTHRGIDPRFGDEQTLRALVTAAHDRGLRVLLDVVVNHRGYGAHGPDTRECEQTADPLRQCIFGLPDLRTEDPAVFERIVVDATAWVRDFGVDGLRIDAARHVEPELVRAIHERGEADRGGELLVIGEWWGATPDDARALLLDGAAADTLFDFTFDGLTLSFLNGRMRAEAIAHHLEELTGSFRPLVLSLDTHDTSSFLHRLGDDAHRYPLAAVLLFSTRGVPLVTWGDELERGGGPWPDNRASMPWSKLETKDGARVHKLWRDLISLRHKLPALRGPTLRTKIAHTDDDGATLVFARGDDEVYVAVHRGAGAVERLKLPKATPPSLCLASDGVRVAHDGGDAWSLTLPADSFAVLVPGRCP